MEGFWIQVYISRRHLFVKVCQWAKYLGLLEVLWKFLKDNSLRFLWYSKNQKFSPLNPHSNRGSFLLCTFLRSFWIFQTVCCELQLFVQSKRLPPQLSQYISNSPTPCIYICAIITSILRQSTGTSLKWSKWKNLPSPNPTGGPDENRESNAFERLSLRVLTRLSWMIRQNWK